MRRLFLALCAFVGILTISIALTEVHAQPGGKKGGKGSSETMDEFVAKLMALNKAKDGKLTKEELTDKRLHALFDRADTNKDGVVTRAELEALFAREKLEGGDKGKGPKDGFGPDKNGFKGKGPQPGVILPGVIQDALNLTDTQRKQIADLQKEVDGKLDKILTDDQRTQLREMREKGPKGPPPDKK